jgi:hypothetical protein
MIQVKSKWEEIRLDEVIELRKKLFSIECSLWTENMLFSLKWWILIIIVIVMWYAW